ncbi:hypothetical protein Angca_000327, partial [Angiostrongylus cantonensis]
VSVIHPVHIIVPLPLEDVEEELKNPFGLSILKNRLDCIIGYAFVYALAPVARMCPYWQDDDSNGIPVITPIGLTMNLDNKMEYQTLTRISGPYKV